MQSLSLKSLFLLIAALTVATTTFATNGRGFAGVFNVRDVNSASDLVTLTLDVQLQNHSGTSIADAIVTLQDRYSSKKNFGTFSSVQISNPGIITLSGQFSVPVREYALWKKGATPFLAITYRDPSGQTIREQITLTRRAIAGVN